MTKKGDLVLHVPKKPARHTAKKTDKKKRLSSIKRTSNEIIIEKTLIENFISLQRVLVNLSSKLDDLTKQISNLLQLFEISAKSLAEKDLTKEKDIRENKEIIKKIDGLLEQNKIIARGMTLMHEQNAGTTHPLQKPQTSYQGMSGYQRSLPTQEQEPIAHPKFKPLPRG